MKKLLLFLTVCSIYTVSDAAMDDTMYVADEVVVGEQEPVGCRCYCSDKCGLRDAKPTDTPFFDEEYNKCFCKQRDKDNYMINQCDLQEQIEPATCCGGQ